MNCENEYVQYEVPDKMKLAELVIKAKGLGRTMAQFSEQTGINTSTLSRIANGKIQKPLAMETLEKIYEFRDEESGLSMDSLYAANGTVKKRIVEENQGHAEKVSESRRMAQRDIRLAKNAVTAALLARGICLAPIPEDLNVRRSESPFGIYAPYDFHFYINDEAQKYWYFKVISDGGSESFFATSSRVFLSAGRLFLLDAWQPNFLEGQKTTFVFFRRDLYEAFILTYRDAPIKSAVTAMLIDADGETIEDEKWLSCGAETASVLDRPLSGDEGNAAVWLDDEMSCTDDMNEP